MLIEVRAEWAEWIEGSYMSQKSQVQDKTCLLRYGLNGLNVFLGYIWAEWAEWTEGSYMA